MKQKSFYNRVDIQVGILVTVLVVISCFVVFIFAYSLSYKQMINSLAARVSDIANYVDANMENDAFLESCEVTSEEYKNAQAFLLEIREISSAQYLYTAIRNANGQLVYLVDGLPSTDSDFRLPGDPIEADFIDDLSLALEGNIVMPDDIKNTEWGDVFVAYYPIHEGTTDEVIGAIGIEFPASAQYEAFKYIRLTTPIKIILTCLLAFFISRALFRRISNPHFKDLSNTDSLTGLKNRNAYQLDLDNFMESGRVKKHALLLADLNSLKLVNDQLGHKMGDEYIKSFAKAIIGLESDKHIAYRIGGDEFAILFLEPSLDDIENYIKLVKMRLKENAEKIPFASVAIGYAFCDVLNETTWEQTQIDADFMLYQDKKAFYDNNQLIDKRR